MIQFDFGPIPNWDQVRDCYLACGPPVYNFTLSMLYYNLNVLRQYLYFCFELLSRPYLDVKRAVLVKYFACLKTAFGNAE